MYRRAQAMHLPWGPVRWPEENLADPHWDDRGFFVEAPVPGAAAPARYPRAGYRFTATPVEFRHPAPHLGEHNAEVFEAIQAD